MHEPKLLIFLTFGFIFVISLFIKMLNKKIPLKNSIIINVPFKNIKMYLVERQSIFCVQGHRDYSTVCSE